MNDTRTLLLDLRTRLQAMTAEIDAALGEGAQDAAPHIADVPAMVNAAAARHGGLPSPARYDAVIPLHKEVAGLLKGAFARGLSAETLIGIIQARKQWDWALPQAQSLRNIVSDAERGNLEAGKNTSITNMGKLNELRDMLRDMNIQGAPLLTAAEGETK